MCINRLREITFQKTRDKILNVLLETIDCVTIAMYGCIMQEIKTGSTIAIWLGCANRSSCSDRLLTTCFAYNMVTM